MNFIEKVLEKVFCSPGNQVVLNPPMANHVFTKDRFAEIFRILRKVFSVNFVICSKGK